jgi:cystathionine beta-lyase/cystathionine gamma-synthase
MAKKKGFSTKILHPKAHYPSNEPSTTLSEPVFRTTGFSFSDTTELENYLSGKIQRPIYSRYSNPNQYRVEEILAELEHTEKALVFASGIAAISAVLQTYLRPGDNMILLGGIYGGTNEFIKEILIPNNITVTIVNPSEIHTIEQHVTDKTKLIYIEIPTNPLLYTPPIGEIVAVAKRHKLMTVSDNTVATPYNLTAHDHGVDIIIHSASKYLNGHSDILAGAVCADKELIKPIMNVRKTLGATLDAEPAWLLERGLKTLEVRVQKHNESAKRIAEHLSKKGLKTYYPSLNHDDPNLKYYTGKGYGGLLSFEAGNSLEDAKKFVDGLELFILAPTLGGVESLVNIPTMTSHRSYTKEQRLSAGIKPNLVRLSVGIEDCDDLIADIEQALEGIK